MKVIFDHQIFSRQDFGGVSRYFAMLYEQLKGDPEVDISLPIRVSNNHHLEGIGLKGVRSYPGLKNNIFRRKLFAYINSKYTRKEVNDSKFDLFHPTYYSPYFTRFINDKPFVLTVFDMIHELFPQHIKRFDVTTKRKRMLVDRAAHILAISENTKRDLIRIFNTPEEKITVTHLASFGESRPQKVDLPENYLLYVGDRKDYKNFGILLEALSSLQKELGHVNLVCVGGGGFSADEVQHIAQSGLSGRVVQKNLSDAQLSYAYRNAVAYVCTSLYEGFGLSVLEAMKNGCPVIASDTSSLPEVGGDAALYFSPDNPVSLAERLAEVMEESVQRNLIKLGKKQESRFDWSKTAQETKSIYMRYA